MLGADGLPGDPDAGGIGKVDPAPGNGVMGAHAAQQATHSAAIMSRFGTWHPSDKSVFPTLDFSLRIRFRDRRLACIAGWVCLQFAAVFGRRLFALKIREFMGV